MGDYQCHRQGQQPLNDRRAAQCVQSDASPLCTTEIPVGAVKEVMSSLTRWSRQ